MKKFGRLAALLSILLTVSLILSACGGETPTPAPTATSATGAAPTTASQPATGQGKTVTVEEQDFQFSPKDVTINVGDTVTFVNKGGTAHTATASDNSWDSSSMDVGASFSHTFSAAGKVTYYCKFHGTAAGKGMSGTITVVQGSSAAPAATPTTAVATTPTTAIAAATPTTAAAAAPTTASGNGGSTTVELQDYKFVPANITVNVGGSINFVNKGAVTHTATAGDGSWDSGNLDAGA
ncbi:MAG: hypothetical protein DLM69_03530, partial [Candidatus Chloroheliales bacterium]